MCVGTTLTTNVIFLQCQLICKVFNHTVEPKVNMKDKEAAEIRSLLTVRMTKKGAEVKSLKKKKKEKVK